MLNINLEFSKKYLTILFIMTYEFFSEKLVYASNYAKTGIANLTPKQGKELCFF